MGASSVTTHGILNAPDSSTRRPVSIRTAHRAGRVVLDLGVAYLTLTESDARSLRDELAAHVGR